MHNQLLSPYGFTYDITDMNLLQPPSMNEKECAFLNACYTKKLDIIDLFIFEEEIEIHDNTLKTIETSQAIPADIKKTVLDMLSMRQLKIQLKGQSLL